MTRIKSFAAPHKGLRNVISQFSLRLGYTDFSDPTPLHRLKALGEEMFTLLNDHVHTENEHTLKHLEQRAPGSSEHDRHDHERLEEIQQALEQQLIRFSGNESSDDIHAYYLSFSLFQSQYFEHIYEEETVTERLLQEHFTDEELIQHRIDIMQSIQFPVLLLWLKYIIPAQAGQESVAMLKAFKANAPTETFGLVLETIKKELATDRYNSLLSHLS
jgi:hypothetical protein